MSDDRPTWERLVYDYMADMGLFANDANVDHTACETVTKNWWTVSRVLRTVCMPWAASTCVNCWDENNWINWNLRQHADMSAALASLRLREPNLDRIRTAERLKVRYVLFFVGWYWIAAEDNQPAGHATLLWVDTETRQYDLFDPTEHDGREAFATGGREYALHLTEMVRSRRPSIIPNYHPYRHKVIEPPVQTVVQSDILSAGHPCQFMAGGQCAMVCLLVLICCQRFQTGDVWDVALAIRDVYKNWIRTNEERTSWLNNLQHLFRRLTMPWLWDDLQRLLGLLVTDNKESSDRRCRVFEDGGTRICALPACPGFAYCPVHRHYLLDVRTEASPDCDRPIEFLDNPTDCVPDVDDASFPAAKRRRQVTV